MQRRLVCLCECDSGDVAFPHSTAGKGTVCVVTGQGGGLSACAPPIAALHQGVTCGPWHAGRA